MSPAGSASPRPALDLLRITFAIYLEVPVDPAGFLVDMQHASPQQIANAHHLLGTDRPAIVQYGKHMGRLLHGDFGTSWATISFFGGSAVGSPVGPWSGGPRSSPPPAARRLHPDPARRVPLGVFAATAALVRDRLSVALGIAAISTHPLVVGLLSSCSSGAAGSCCLLPGTARSRSRRQRVVAEAAVAAPTGTPLPCGGAGSVGVAPDAPVATFALFFVALYIR